MARDNGKLSLYQQIVSVIVGRNKLARLMGQQYDGKRDVYKTLGYPDERDLKFAYYLAKYERQDIATAIIDRPANAAWNSFLHVMEADSDDESSVLKKQWFELDSQVKITQNLRKLDKLMGIGQYAVLLFGFNDVKSRTDFANPVQKGSTLKLMYIKPLSEDAAQITGWEKRPDNMRYGQPLFYSVTVGTPGEEGFSDAIKVHHSRVLHVAVDGLESDIFGRPKLKPVINRLVDLEKLLGGDAEMFWKGARPGYHASGKEGYALDEGDRKKLTDEFELYEHELIRFLMADGVDINALAQQIADPLHHLDAQIQAISAETGIPKRILVGSERGELSSGQDKDQWLALIRSRMEDETEPIIVKPFIKICMDYGILQQYDDYDVVWEDIFALSEREKAEVGKIRSESLKNYVDSLGAMDVLPPDVAAKYLLGLDAEQAAEIALQVEQQVVEEDREMEEVEEDVEEEESEVVE